MKILLTAVEVSGDRLGAGLMRELRKKLGKKVEFYGVGGTAMRAEGLLELYPMARLAAMGLVEVIPVIPRVLACLRLLATWVVAERPSMVICVDGQDFSWRLAGRVKAIDRKIPCVLYGAPKVWAWRPQRAKKLSDLYDLVLCVLPFEVEFLRGFGMRAEYVGHPAIGLVEKKADDVRLELALLPGSRVGELRRHWPLMLATLRRLRLLVPQIRGLLVLPDEKSLQTCKEVVDFDDQDALDVVVGEGRFAALRHCKAALAKSGTNTLELALLGVPAVVCYKMNPLTHWIAKRLVRLPVYSLPNLILNPQVIGGGAVGEVVYPEFIQTAATAENLGRALYPLLVNEKARGRQLRLLGRLADLMQVKTLPAEMAAEFCLLLK